MCKGCNNLDLSQSMQALSMNLSTIAWIQIELMKVFIALYVCYD